MHSRKNRNVGSVYQCNTANGSLGCRSKQAGAAPSIDPELLKNAQQVVPLPLHNHKQNKLTTIHALVLHGNGATHPQPQQEIRGLN